MAWKWPRAVTIAKARGVALIIGWGRLNGNHHDWRHKPGLTCEWPRYENRHGHVRRSTADVVELGADCYLIVEGRRTIGRRLWLYGPSGACVHFDVILRFDKSPYRPPSKYAAQPNWTPEEAIQL